MNRLKLRRGISQLLRVDLDWSQFDALWTRLDIHRSGDIDQSEFMACFGEERAKDYSDRLNEAAKVLLGIAACLHRASLSLHEIFSAFDQSSDGKVSVSEFSSLAVMILPEFDKKTIHQSFILLDTDGDKNVSIEELSLVIYHIWRAQLDHLARGITSSRRSSSLIEAREKLINTITRSFSRQERDAAEAGLRSLVDPTRLVLHRIVAALQEGVLHMDVDSLQETESRPRTGSKLNSKRAASISTRLALSNTRRGPTRKGFELSLPPVMNLSAASALPGVTKYDR